MTGRQQGGKVDPSFKSKRYRDKLRTEVKALENLLPVDRPALHRKLDSQTVYRLVIAYLRIKAYFRVHAAPLLREKTRAKENGDDKTGSCDQSIDVTKELATPTGNDKKRNISKIEVERLENWLHSSSIYQILDGFLLVLSADGTILYVSENVLQYLGFNQVDLMHRCIYGSIHSDDHLELRSYLEQTPADTGQDSNQGDRVGASGGQDRVSAPVVFTCRMSCFTGNAAGYTKLYCTGKIEDVRLMPRTPRTSDRIVLLYCQPLMMNAGSDVTPELRREVFWSKHDLDLKFKDIDKKAEQIAGYRCNDLQGRSFYDLVHPEDLFTCVTVHRSLNNSSEVRSMYFRLQTKDGGWIWCHSRGKVISKNSKRFSIVFTHCPIRDDDSVFIQQESAIRRRYSLTDLIYTNKYSFHDNGLFSTGAREYAQHDHSFIHANQSRGPLSEPINDDVPCNMLQANPDRCPSTWHALGDRHSPVLPSSHVAHKLTQRDKQLQFAEFKRKQQTDQQSESLNVGQTMSTGYAVNVSTTHGHVPIVEPIYDIVAPLPTFVPAIGHQQTFQPEYISHTGAYEMYDEFGTRFQQPYCDWTNNIVYPNIIQSHAFNFPPSPPPSPKPRLPKGERKRKSTNCDQVDNSVICEGESNKLQIKQEPNSSEEVKNHCVYQSHDINNAQLTSRMNMKRALPDNFASSPGSLYEGSHQHHPPSVLYHITPPIGQFNARAATMLPNNQFDRSSAAANDRKLGHRSSQSCAMTSGCCHVQDSSVQYDTDTSIHMAIVENVESQTLETKHDVAIPAIGSFLEYLNEY